MMPTRILDALAAQGLNSTDVGDHRPERGLKVAKAVHALAMEAGVAFKDQLDARCKIVDSEEGTAGLTGQAMDCLVAFDNVIEEAIKINKGALGEIRSFRMTLTSELAMIETSIKKIQSLGVPKLVSDLEAIGKALSNPYIQKLLKGNANGNEG
jgi:hypothetical protein